MARQIKTPSRTQLTIAGTVVKTQQREGITFYIIPSVLVLTVLIFCYVAPPPASARLDQQSMVAQVTKDVASVPKPTAPAKPAAKPQQTPQPDTPPPADADALAAETDMEDEEDDILAVESEGADTEEDLALWAEEEDDDWIDGGEAEEFVGDENFEALDDDASEAEDEESTEGEEEIVDTEEDTADSEEGDAEDTTVVAPGSTGTSGAPNVDKPAPKSQPTPKPDKKQTDEEFKNKLKTLFD